MTVVYLHGQTGSARIPSPVITFYHPDHPNGYLSTFATYPFQLGDNTWATVEHYFQSQKFADKTLAEQIRLAPSPGEAKRLAKHFRSLRRADWPSVKDQVMSTALRAKFLQHPELASMLLATGDHVLLEDAPDDAYWGRGPDWSGQNRLGQLLMDLRNELRGGTCPIPLATHKPQ